MNWYELAGPDEVKERLEEVFVNTVYNSFTYIQDRTTGELVRVYKYNYEMAEALWGEYSEELLD